MIWRYISIFAIISAFVAGAFLRIYSVGHTVSHITEEGAGPSFGVSGPRALHDFKEPLVGYIGYEIELPNCSAPLGALPIPVFYSSVSPSQYHFRPGDYRVAYLYDGAIYDQNMFSIRLRLLYILNRIRVFLRSATFEEITYYFKIWHPSDCPPLSKEYIVELQHGLQAWANANMH